VIEILKALERLRSKDIHPSIARIKILEYLMNTTSHPTVEMIHSDLLPEMPTLSKTTVYKTVDLLVESGLARLVQAEEHEAHYDADVSDHGHFVCSRCGRIYDLGINFECLELKGLEGFVVSEKNIIFKGFCPRCLSR
jgi:Fur family peroxide stress response transcriptional regulator